MAQQITKNQHWVPQCLLKHFTRDDIWINVFDLSKREVQRDKSIKKVFSEQYLYDTDNLIENFLQRIEDKAAVDINGLVLGDKKLLGNLSEELLAFISVQLFRTPTAWEQAWGFSNLMFYEIVKLDLQARGHEQELIDAVVKGIKFTLCDKRKFGSRLTLLGVVASALLKDMRFHLVQNKTSMEFLISDHPVILYNSFYRDLQSTKSTSLAARGLQLFIPISPFELLCLYDPKVYKYGDKNSSYSIIQDISDVILINEMQVMNAGSRIGFKSESTENEVVRLVEKLKGEKLLTCAVATKNTPKNHQGQTFNNMIVTYRKQKKLQESLSFIKIKKKMRLAALQFEERDKEMSECYRAFIDKVAQQ